MGGLINQTTALSSTNHWAEALKRFCITVGRVAAAVSVFVQLNQYSQILRRQCCLMCWWDVMWWNVIVQLMCWWNQLPDVFHGVGDKSEGEPLQRTHFLLQPSSVEISSGIFTFNTSHSHVEFLQRLVFLVGIPHMGSKMSNLSTGRSHNKTGLRRKCSQNGRVCLRAVQVPGCKCRLGGRQ